MPPTNRNQDPETMTPIALRRVLKRKRGAMSQIARELGLNRKTVSQWLGGRATSRRIEEAVRSRVSEFIAEATTNKPQEESPDAVAQTSL